MHRESTTGKNRTPTTDARRPSSDARSTALRASADIPALAPATSTRFLFMRGSPSALSAACLFAGPMYAASSFCRLRAWFRGRELDGEVKSGTAGMAKLLCGGGVEAMLNIEHTH